MREVEDSALQEASKKDKRNGEDQKTGEAEADWIKKKDGGARLREMEDKDKLWDKEVGGNPKWGEGRTAHLYGK